VVERELTIRRELRLQPGAVELVACDPPEPIDRHAVDDGHISASRDERLSRGGHITTMAEVLSRDRGRDHDRALQRRVVVLDVDDLGDLGPVRTEQRMRVRFRRETGPHFGQDAQVEGLAGAAYPVHARRHALWYAFDRQRRRTRKDMGSHVSDRVDVVEVCAEHIL